jgi:hypothetical protein
MYEDIFKRKKRIPRKFRVLLILFGGAAIIAAVTFTAVIWWRRPIVIVRIGEFILNTEVEELDLQKRVDNPELSARAPNMYGSLNIKIQNIGRQPAQNLSFSFSPRGCRLGELCIYKIDPDCAVQITPSTELRLNPDVWPESIEPQAPWRYVSVKELRPGSEIQIKYKIYREGKQGPSFKFGKITSSNAKIKAFYYRQ